MTDADDFEGGVTLKAVTFGPDGDVLLVRAEPGYPWVPPGGRVRDGEDPAEALAREMAEETGLDVVVGRPVAAMTGAWFTDDGEPMFTLVYGCETDERGVTLNHEHDEYAWLDPDEAAGRVQLEPLSTAIERARRDRRGGDR